MHAGTFSGHDDTTLASKFYKIGCLGTGGKFCSSFEVVEMSRLVFKLGSKDAGMQVNARAYHTYLPPVHTYAIATGKTIDY